MRKNDVYVHKDLIYCSIYDKITTTSQIIAIIIIIIIVIINNHNNATKINENDEKTHLPDTRMKIEKLELAHYE